MGISAKSKNKMLNNVKPVKTEKKEKPDKTGKEENQMEQKNTKKVGEAKEKKNRISEERQKNIDKAAEHNADMEARYAEEIKKCVEGTRFHGAFMKNIHTNLPEGSYVITVEDKDSVATVMDGAGKRQCVLNFASYKHAGGGFLSGSMAQEEALCHESFLYNVLSQFSDDFYKRNQERLFFSLYKNRSLYSPDVIFERDGSVVEADVMTCACPNWLAAKENGVSEEDNEKILRQRIYYILKIMASYGAERIILGAYGCGAFRQNPELVAKIFHQEILRIFSSKKCEIVFAIPSGDNTNYDAFKAEFEKTVTWKDIPRFIDWTPIHVENTKVAESE